MHWKWSYNWFCGIMYGPIPVGAILVFVVSAGYYSANFNRPTDRPRNGDAANPFAGSSRTPGPARHPGAGPAGSSSRRDAAGGADGGSTVEEELNSINKVVQKQMKEQAEERAARDREEKGPDASDPAYLEKMAQRMLSDNFSYSEKALATLLAIDPATASPEAKKQVVLAFKTLAENKRSIQRREAIKGLVKWAGTYSIPALSKMLDNHDSSDDGEIIDALSTFDPATVSPEAKKQVARAFKTLAENRNSFRRREAIKGLVKWAGTYSIPALVKMLDDHDIIVDGEIIKALSAFDPATVSPEAKKQVALAFKMLAEEKYSSEGREAIKGLVKWGGTYSVPVLLKMLNDHNSSNEEEIIKALAELQDTRAVPALVTLLNTGSINEKLILRTLADMKDVRAAPALAAHLRHSYDGSETIARDGLLAMGSGAEDALLALAYTDDFKRCITVLALLGEVGTEKSLETMRRAQSSRDRGVRLTAMNAATKITRRRLELKSRAADKRDP